jgi:uncharacterized protein YkwD
VRLRSISLTLLGALLLVPTGASAASATTPDPTAHPVSATFKTSAYQRQIQAAQPGQPAGVRLVRAVPTTAPAPLTVMSYSDRVLASSNRERTSRGLRALAFSPCADGYADSWATQLSRAGALSHQPLRPIVTACRARGAGENVAFGNVSPEQLVAMWMASPGHRANLLEPESTHIGVGAVTTAGGRVYGVQVFLTV